MEQAHALLAITAVKLAMDSLLAIVLLAVQTTLEIQSVAANAPAKLGTMTTEYRLYAFNAVTSALLVSTLQLVLLAILPYSAIPPGPNALVLQVISKIPLLNVKNALIIVSLASMPRLVSLVTVPTDFTTLLL